MKDTCTRSTHPRSTPRRSHDAVASITAIVDADLAANARHGPMSDAPDPCAAALTACLHAAVSVASASGTGRRDIELRAGLGRCTLDDYLSAKPSASIKSGPLARMLFDASVLGPAGHGALWDALMMAGTRAVLAPAVPAGPDELGVAFLNTADGVGALAEQLREATDPGSPGGAVVVAIEHTRIGAYARTVSIDAASMIPPMAGLDGLVAGRGAGS